MNLIGNNNKHYTGGALLLCCVVFLLMLTACGSSKQAGLTSIAQQELVVDLPAYLPVIKMGDQLDIELLHPLITYSYTAEVENDGSIVLPGMARFKVIGITTRELEQLLVPKLEQPVLSEAWSKTIHESSFVPSANLSLTDSSTTGSSADGAVLKPKARISNFSISVLGLVERPGQYPVPEQHITIFEALSLAGYKTMNTKHGTIKVLREANDGKLTFYTLNLDDKSIVNSPAYYLEQNDVLYVHPTRTSKWASGLSSPSALGITSLVSLLISVATLVVHIVKP